MRLVVLGLSLSSSWGNGHATTFRALLSAFHARGHEVLFLERLQPWYADNRDLADPDFCRFAYYNSLEDLGRWRSAIEDADAVIVGSYVPEGVRDADHLRPMARDRDGLPAGGSNNPGRQPRGGHRRSRWIV